MTSINFTELAGQDELDLDDIEAVLAGGSEKGKYKEDVIQFAMSNKLGVPYQFSGKKAASVKTGLESAKEAVGKDEKIEDDVKAAVANTVVRVRKVGEGDAAQELVFLIREDLRRAAKSQSAAA